MENIHILIGIIVLLGLLMYFSTSKETFSRTAQYTDPNTNRRQNQTTFFSSFKDAFAKLFGR